MSISDFAKQRDEVLFSLDRERINTFYAAKGLPPEKNEIVFWAGVYKAILVTTSAPQGLREKATTWLTAHGFSTEINFDNL